MNEFITKMRQFVGTAGHQRLPLWSRLLLLWLLYCKHVHSQQAPDSGSAGSSTSAPTARYYHTPLHEIIQQPLYLKTTAFNEIVVAYSDKGSDLREGDYLTHADGIRILNGGLQAFLKSGEKEAIVPIVEDKDVQHDGKRFLGFVLLQVVTPRKLSTRRGEIVFDLDEGGPEPVLNLGNIVVSSSGASTKSDPGYQPPPHGTGACITGRDCYNFNGTCINGQCSCLGPYTGSYCQVKSLKHSDSSLTVNSPTPTHRPSC